MTLREFFCLLAAIAAYCLVAWFVMWLTTNGTAAALVGVVAFTGVAIAADEITDKHRHGGW